MKRKQRNAILNELIEAKDNKHSYGGNVAEIYTYRFRDDLKNDVVIGKDCGSAVNEIISEFQRAYPEYQVLIHNVDKYSDPTLFFKHYSYLYFDRIHLRVEPVNKNIEIKIEISGLAGSGKTKIAYLISECLMEHGFPIEYKSIDGDNDKNLGDLCKTAKEISNITNIIITEKQLERENI